MKTKKALVCILFAAFLISALSVSSFAKIEETDLDESLRFYHRMSKMFTEDFISCVYGTDETLTTDVNILDGCEDYLAQAALFLKKSIAENYELDFSVNELELDEGGGNIHITSVLICADSSETLDLFIKIGTPQKVITIVDAYIVGDAALEKILYPETEEPMTLKNFVAWASEHGENEYKTLAGTLEPYTDYTPDVLPDAPNDQPSDDGISAENPTTADVSMIFYILTSIATVLSCFIIGKKA